MVYDLWFGKLVTEGGCCRHIKLMPCKRSMMCGAAPLAFHCSGFSFWNLSPCRCVNQVVGSCMGIGGIDPVCVVCSVGTGSILSVSGGIVDIVDVGMVGRMIRSFHCVVSSCENCVWLIKYVMASKPGDDASG
jgi:hypothetical protein